MAALQAMDKRVRDKGRSRTQIAAELGLGYDQYARYVNGDTPIRFEQIDLFAGVYGVHPHDLGRAILSGDLTDLEWTMAGALRSHIPEADIPAFEAEWAGKTVLEQRAAAEGIIANANRARARATTSRRRNQTA